METQHLTRSDGHMIIPTVFVVLQLTAGAGIFVILCTALLSPGVKRSPTWISFCTSWILSCFSYTLLAMAGQLTRTQPDFAICVTQAGLIYAAPILEAGSTLAIILNLWFKVRSVVSQKAEIQDYIMVILVPYIAWLAMLTGVLVYGQLRPQTVRKSVDGTYCDLTISTPSIISSVWVAISMVLCLALDARIMVYLRHNWFLFSRRTSTLSMIIRVLVFSLVHVISIMISIVLVVPGNHGAGFELILALLPVAVILIFGTQKDLILAWKFWKN